MNLLTRSMQVAGAWWSQLTAHHWVQRLWPIAICASMILTVVHPLMFGAMPATDDGIAHLHRLITLDDNIRHGQIWPRYSPATVFGYGSPPFNFYSPVSLYPAEFFHLLGLSFLDALLASLIFYTFMGALGAYTLGKSWGGAIAGIGTATAMIYAPYMLYNMIHRFALAEYAALMFIPWVIWAFQQTAWQGQRRDFVLAVLFYALIVLLHNITALVSTTILVVYSLYLWWTAHNPPRVFIRLLMIGVLAAGLTAFYWLPALMEANDVQIGRIALGVIAPPDSPQFGMHFQTLAQTLDWPATADLTRLTVPVQRTLGWPSIILGLIGIGFMSYWEKQSDGLWRKLRGRIVIAGLVVVFTVFMMTKESAWLWLHIPLIKNFQLPWRWLGLASILLALLTGLGIMAVARRIPWRLGQIIWLIVSMASITLYGMPWLYRQYLPGPLASNVIEMHNYERQTEELSGVAYGDFLPRWVVQIPDSKRLEGLYAQYDIIPRLQPLPRVITVKQANWRYTGGQLTFSAKEATTLTFDWLYFPGWWAKMDGEPVDLFPTQPSGFIGIRVPEGEHTIEIGFGSTPLRLGATITSGVFLLFLMAILLFAGPIWQPADSHTSEIDLIPTSSTQWIVLTAISIGVMLFISKSLLIDNIQTPIKQARFVNGIEAGLQIPIQANFERKIDLLGYDIQSFHLTPGQTTQLTLYWQLSHGEIEEDYSTVIYLRDSEGTIIAQTDSVYPGGWPTSYWISGFHVPDYLDVTIPPGTPPGSYTLDASLFWYTNDQALDAFDKQGTPLGVTVPIGELVIERPERVSHVDDLRLEADRSLGRLDAQLTDDIRLVAANKLPDTAEVGQLFIFMAYWQAQSRPKDAHNFQILWLGKDEQVAAATPSTSLAVNYPTDQWESEDIWKGLHPLYIPGRLEAGDYTIALQLFDENEAIGARIEMGKMAVSTPPRDFQSPQMNTASDVAWENGIHLLGYDFPDQDAAQGDGLELTLYWQTETDISTSLTIFVHIYDAEGTIVVQQDRIPLSGTRPTTSWAPGEILTDRYAILIPGDTPPDCYQIRIGIYNATTRERIKLPDDSEFWVLPESLQVISR
ncbi:MAG: hypothetical protein JXB07_11340 [Anaerolineae bacterium]|nr:hypothetical protein [Anaerolineae bacterium]